MKIIIINIIQSLKWLRLILLPDLYIWISSKMLLMLKLVFPSLYATNLLVLLFLLSLAVPSHKLLSTTESSSTISTAEDTTNSLTSTAVSICVLGVIILI